MFQHARFVSESASGRGMHCKIDMTQRAYSLINTISAPLHTALYNRRDYAVASATAESNRIAIPDIPH